MKKITHFPTCLPDERIAFSAKDMNRQVDDAIFEYKVCNCCGVYRLNSVPAQLHKYYPADYYALPTKDKLSALADADQFKIKTVLRYVQKGRLLEIGGAFGVFAHQAKASGFDVNVVEMDVRCCSYLREVVGVNVIQSSAPVDAMSDLPQHDVIALWHVIEHLPDPWRLMSEAARNLDKNGVLIIATPNPYAWQFKLMGKYWPHVDAPRHLYLIPEQTLSKYADTLGLKRLHVSTTDSDAKSWNRFGWQRLLMNCFTNRWIQRLCYVMGYFVALLMAPFEIREPRGSAYTVVYRKI
jgi:2-polyprenyl-3-methyl-5-hydroxy-6-metoxy-1,4-benzoquinol methylase